jgi:hypothetical protein
VRKIGNPKESEVKRMNLNVPVALHNQFKSTTAAEGQNMTDVLIEFIEDYVREHSAPKPKGRRR